MLAWLAHWIYRVERRHADELKILQARVALLNRAVIKARQRRGPDSQKTVRMTEQELEAAKRQK